MSDCYGMPVTKTHVAFKTRATHVPLPWQYNQIVPLKVEGDIKACKIAEFPVVLSLCVTQHSFITQ